MYDNERTIITMLEEAGIISRASQDAIERGPEYDEEESFVSIDYDKGVIITLYTNEVLPPAFHLYDLFTFEPIGGQDVYKDDNPAPFGGWSSWGSDVVDLDDEEPDYRHYFY